MATIGAVLAQIRNNESGGNYSLTPQQNYAYPASHASGAYQFQPATWQTYTASSGIGTQYSQAYQAPPSVQDAVATYALQQNNGNPNLSSLWGASSKGGSYPTVTDWSGSTSGATIAAGPADNAQGSTPASDPALGYSVTQNPSGTSPTTPGSQPGTAEGTTQLPVSVGIQPGMWSDITTEINKIMTGTATAFETAVGTWFGSVQNWFVRAFLIIVGIIIIGVALAALMWDHGGKEVIVNAGRAVAA